MMSQLFFVGLVLGVCQATLGVGVVLFGIPVYLFLGSSFTDAAIVTLPISVVCSILVLVYQRVLLPKKFIISSILQVPFLVIFTIVMVLSSAIWLLKLSYLLIIFGSLYTLYLVMFNQNLLSRYFTPQSFIRSHRYPAWCGCPRGAVLLLVMSMSRMSPIEKVKLVSASYLTLCLLQYMTLILVDEFKPVDFEFALGVLTGLSTALIFSRKIPELLPKVLLITCVAFNIFTLMQKIINETKT